MFEYANIQNINIIHELAILVVNTLSFSYLKIDRNRSMLLESFKLIAMGYGILQWL